ncbi:MAG: DNA polymerase III subunit delta' [Gammaproteobacteria bacterium]|nr:DNA polymerase III subunit delta' [Gammaproteobacteria bacterium]
MNLKIFPWQRQQWQYLVGTYQNGRLPHGLLLTGPSGTGMEDFTDAFAVWLLCNNQGEQGACGECPPCKQALSGNHPDLHLVEPEEPGKQIKVDPVRALIEFTQFTSQYKGNKVAIIRPAHAMNRNAANALLKTLEEPADNVILLLVSDSPSKLPVTIRSRCQRTQFSSVDRESGLEWLSDITQADSGHLESLWELAQGKPLHARDMVENDVAGHQIQVVADLRDLLAHRTDFMQITQKWTEYGASDVFNWLIYLMVTMTRTKLIVGSEKGKSPNNRDLQEIVNQLNLQQLMNCYDLARRHYQAATGLYNLNQTGLIEDFLLFWQGQTTTGG